jgi:polyribonucleotide nucleotidyltransferase
VLTESQLSLGLVIDIEEYNVMTDVEFEQVDHKFDLELDVNGKLISISNYHMDLNLLIGLDLDHMLNLSISYFCWYYASYSTLI